MQDPVVKPITAACVFQLLYCFQKGDYPGLYKQPWKREMKGFSVLHKGVVFPWWQNQLLIPD